MPTQRSASIPLGNLANPPCFVRFSSLRAIVTIHRTVFGETDLSGAQALVSRVVRDFSLSHQKQRFPHSNDSYFILTLSHAQVVLLVRREGTFHTRH